MLVLPDILRYDRTQPAAYPNGRVPTNDVYSMRFVWPSHGKVPPTGLKPHDDVVAEFPYLGRPTPDGSVRPSARRRAGRAGVDRGGPAGRYLAPYRHAAAAPDPALPIPKARQITRWLG
jgi:hypothetical protein